MGLNWPMMELVAEFNVNSFEYSDCITKYVVN